ncbi:MAG: large subunit ribosomal protein [Actinomycetota bacterium]|jgi:large subunit ribosomal protein L24|nr:large subunit ribosomal protein [Actinomycetota bacterium]
MKLTKGDRVRVRAGKDRGKEGVIMRVLPDEDRVIVDGVNRAKKHQRATKATMQGGIIDKEMPMPASAVAIVCPNDGPTRIGYRIEKNAAGVMQKIRVCRKCGAELPRRKEG